MTDPSSERREALLAWYEPRRQAYPWRRTGDPYAILVSEVMLQQTQASRVVPAFERFLDRFPTAAALAAAPRSAVVREWDGLGYNRRAVALWRAAAAIERAHGGGVPGDPGTLRSLPGIGPYTAAAVASIAFGVRVAAVDTNVRRIVSRVFGIRDVHDIEKAATSSLDPDDPGTWNQALMDLGREVCRPRPRCPVCPLRRSCASAHADEMPAPPRRLSGRFEGSSRQVRGAIVRELRRRRTSSLATLSIALDRDLATLAAAVRSLHADGLVAAGRAALDGRPRGRVRLE